MSRVCGSQKDVSSRETESRVLEAAIFFTVSMEETGNRYVAMRDIEQVNARGTPYQYVLCQHPFTTVPGTYLIYLSVGVSRIK